MNFYKVICNDNINYKFNLSLEAAKTIFMLWNVRLKPNSGFNLILSQTSIYFCILSILNEICAFQELIEVEDCYFGYGFHLKAEVIYTVYCSSFCSLFFYPTSYTFTLHNSYPVHM